MASVEERLDALEAVQEIHRLKARYGTLMDARYDRKGPKTGAELEALADEAARLFTEDAEWDGGKTLGLARGRDAIRRRFLEPTLLFSWHLFVKPEIRVEGDRAEGTWDVLAPFTARDGRPHWMAGVEHDTYRRVDGVWLHQSMSLRVTLFAPHEDGWGKPPAR